LAGDGGSPVDKSDVKLEFDGGLRAFNDILGETPRNCDEIK